MYLNFCAIYVLWNHHHHGRIYSVLLQKKKIIIIMEEFIVCLLHGEHRCITRVQIMQQCLKYGVTVNTVK